jgi:hypothetical protein
VANVTVRYVGNTRSFDRTDSLRVTDALGVERIVERGETVVLSDSQRAELSQLYMLPVDTGPVTAEEPQGSLQYAAGAESDGDILVRWDGKWRVLLPGPAGTTLMSAGPGRPPFWASPAGGTSTGGGGTTSTGTVVVDSQGLIPANKVGTGAASTLNFLRGDRQWAEINLTPPDQLPKVIFSQTRPTGKPGYVWVALNSAGQRVASPVLLGS